MDPKLLAKILRSLRLTVDTTEGQVVAAMNRINHLMAAEGLSWPDLLGGDPDKANFPQQPVWFSGSGLQPEEMQSLFDAGYAKGHEDALQKTLAAEHKKSIDWFLDQAAGQTVAAYTQRTSNPPGPGGPSPASSFPFSVPRPRSTPSTPSNMTSDEIEKIIRAADVFMFGNPNHGFTPWQMDFIGSYLRRPLPWQASLKQAKALYDINKHMKTNAMRSFT